MVLHVKASSRKGRIEYIIKAIGIRADRRRGRVCIVHQVEVKYWAMYMSAVESDSQ